MILKLSSNPNDSMILLCHYDKHGTVKWWREELCTVMLRWIICLNLPGATSAILQESEIDVEQVTQN